MSTVTRRRPRARPQGTQGARAPLCRGQPRQADGPSEVATVCTDEARKCVSRLAQDARPVPDYGLQSPPHELADVALLLSVYEPITAITVETSGETR